MLPVSVLDYRDLARKRLPKFLFEYLEGGSYGEVTLRRNIEDLERIALRQRVLRDVSHIDLSTEIFGQQLALPVALGPVGLAGLNARRGEVQAVRAAKAAGVPFCLSTLSACPLQEVVNAAHRPFWFQLYMIRDRAFMRDLLAQVKEAGCTTLVFTVDMGAPGARYRDFRSGLAGPQGVSNMLRRFWQAAQRPHWAWDVALRGRPLELGNVAPALGRNRRLKDFFNWMRENVDPSVSWRDLEAIRAEWPGTLVVKGILDAADARQVVGIGADGLVVSNHGGRQLDGALSTASALPPIVDAVGEEFPVLVDGGVRSGLDVVRMLALGAKGVLLGRAWAYALAAGGERGVRHMLALIQSEMRVAMALTGVTSVRDLDRQLLADTAGIARP